MRTPLVSRLVLGLWTAATMVFLYLPLYVVARLSLSTTNSVNWPPEGWTTSWWSEAWDTDAPRTALINSLKVATVATIIALLLGTLAAFALQRFAFFGKNAVSFLIVLPIALPGIVTGIALQNTFSRRVDLGFFDFSVGLGFHSLVISHATFCVVIVYNNVIARLRRSTPNLLEASADLGAHGIQTFRYVTFPLVRSALLAGGLLAFALSFDEIVVTTFTSGSGFQTLPQWILANISRPKLVPIVNVVATFVMLMSIPAAWLAQRLSDGASETSFG
jgi:putative spermidine/putrescine transport system permease protein